mgnify:CR=1 FL=1
MGNVRVLTALVLALLATTAAIYLSGYLALLFLGMDGELLRFGTYFDYLKHLQHPRVQPYAWRIKAAGSIGGGLMLLAWAALVVMLFKLRSHRNLHGRARFAGMVDVARKGFLGSRHDGIVVGQLNGRLLRLPGQQFVILAAPTRSGRTCCWRGGWWRPG